MSSQKVPIFVINLDRRPDRLEYMRAQLDELQLDWSRVSALDATVASDNQIAKEVRLTGHKIGMGRGSQCCAISNFDIYRSLLASDQQAALILQDDVALSPDISAFVEDLDWLPTEIGLVQFEKFGRRKSARLAGAAYPQCQRAGRSLRRLYSRTAGAGCYLITREAAQLVLDNKPLLEMPIDHFLFSPNVSPLFDRLGVAIVTPAVAVQRMEEFTSDLARERIERPKKLSARLRRLWFELNRFPVQMLAMARGARFVPFDVPDDLGQGGNDAED